MMGADFKKGICAGVLGTVLLAVGCFAGYQCAAGHSSDSVLSDSTVTEKLSHLEEMIDSYYLEDKDEEQLAEGLYAGLIYGLGDAYSCYYTAEEYEEESTSTEGAYVGIGVVMQKNREGGVLIVSCYEGGPGDQAGLKAGDIVSTVDGVDVTDASVSDVSDMIRGSEAESTTLTIHRENVDDSLEITVEITDVEIPSVSHEMLEDQIGYIRITEFNANTPAQYKEAFSDLSDAGMEKLVVDLRDNPGGLLTSVSDVLREILPEGLIVYTEDKNGNREEVTCDGEHPLDMPLAVLVNENSASAAEIFAGAVQDYGIGTIVGTTTYGKGVVQSIYPLSDGSAVKLTVSRYYTPKGHNIHGTGITPDVEEKLDASLLNKDSYSHEEDNQLQRALSVLQEDESKGDENS